MGNADALKRYNFETPLYYESYDVIVDEFKLRLKLVSMVVLVMSVNVCTNL